MWRPIKRFVAPAISDTEMNPAGALKLEDLRMARTLSADPSPARGRFEAPVRIVEFADFQCQYCRDLDKWIRAFPPALAQETRTIYKYFPLSIHPWARAAATAAACAELQSQDAFWEIHDFLYREQSQLTAGALSSRLVGNLSGRLGPKISDYHACLAGRSADFLVDRDIALGRSLRVNSTPTVFMNGARLPALQTAEELIAYVRQALLDARDIASATKDQ
jgi:protein-disulfide isomerase